MTRGSPSLLWPTPRRASNAPFVRESTNPDLTFVLSRTINLGALT